MQNVTVTQPRRPFTPSRRRDRLATARAAVIAAAAVTAVAMALAAPAGGSVRLFADDFGGRDRLLTNEFAYWNPHDPLAIRSTRWEMDSGSLFVRNGAAWTGRPDDVAPNARSTTGTDSAIFRLRTRRHDFVDVAVTFNLRNLGFTRTEKTPRDDWDGVHIWLRYQTEQGPLYYASINRRDRKAVIKKKCPGGSENGGKYVELSPEVPHGFPLRHWQHVRATISTLPTGAVAITLFAEGRIVAAATDAGSGGCAPIRRGGAVGLRGDNDEFETDDFVVDSLR